MRPLSKRDRAFAADKPRSEYGKRRKSFLSPFPKGKKRKSAVKNIRPENRFVFGCSGLIVRLFPRFPFRYLRSWSLAMIV